MLFLLLACTEEEPAAPEEECTPVEYYEDRDADGWGGLAATGCPVPEGAVLTPGDCSDFDKARYPGAEEVCDWKDNDCNGQIDEGMERIFLGVDADGDGFGSPIGPTEEACSELESLTLKTATDCDDWDALSHPNGTEDCTAPGDEDCDGLVSCEDADCAGSDACEELDCDNGLDDDGDGMTDCADDECWAAEHCQFDIELVATGGWMRHYQTRYFSDETWMDSYFSGQSVTGAAHVRFAEHTAECRWTAHPIHGSFEGGLLIPPLAFDSDCPVKRPVSWSVNLAQPDQVQSAIWHSEGRWLVFEDPHYRRSADKHYVGSPWTGSLTTGDPWTWTP